MPVRRRLEGEGAATWLPFAESKLRLLKDRIRRYPGHIRTQWLTTDNGTDIYLEAGAIDEIFIKTAQTSGGVAVLYTGARRQVTPDNPYYFLDTKYLIRVYDKDKFHACGLHHSRKTGSGRLAGAGRVQQLHSSGPH